MSEQLEEVGSQPPPRRFRQLGRLLWPLFAIGAIVALGPLALLTVIAETRGGRLAGFWALATLGMLVLSMAAFRSQRPWSWAVGLVILAGLWAWLGWQAIVNAPPGRSSSEYGVLQSRFLGEGNLRRHSPLNLIPEVDQVKLAVTLMSRLVPWMKRDHASRLRQIATRLALEAEMQPDQRELGSVSYLAVDELIGRSFDAGHYYAYVPKPRAGEKLGAIVFLHGNGGNLKLFAWAWRAFAEEARFAIICPTYGFGFWGEEGAATVERVRRDALEHFPIDHDRVYLGGISDGGNGVTRTGRRYPHAYRGLIYFSPTMRRDELGSDAFSRGWAGRPVLVFQGDRDWNVPKKSVDPAIDLLREQGCRVTYSVFPGEDHFLFFARSRELFDAIRRWMASEEAAPR